MKKYIDIVISFLLGLVLLTAFTHLAEMNGWATYDLGIVQKLFLASAEFPLIHGISKLFFLWSFPVLFKYIDKDFNENSGWNVLSEREKTWAGLLLRCWDLLCFVLLVACQ
jgi:hypothetical protein